MSKGGFLVHRSHYGEKIHKKTGTSKDAADKLGRGIKRKTRKHDSAEEKIMLVSAGLRGEESKAALCCRDGIAASHYYSWSKEFLEAGKNRLAGDTARQATSSEVEELRSESIALKEVVAELKLENRLLKKSMIGDRITECGVSNIWLGPLRCKSAFKRA